MVTCDKSNKIANQKRNVAFKPVLHFNVGGKVGLLQVMFTDSEGKGVPF
jgi:hypothetical protein